MLKRYNGKIQIGKMLLDAEIEIEEKFEIPPEARADIERIRRWLYGTRMSITVEGSLVEPIIDPAKLLKEAFLGDEDIRN